MTACAAYETSQTIEVWPKLFVTLRAVDALHNPECPQYKVQQLPALYAVHILRPADSMIVRLQNGWAQEVETPLGRTVEQQPGPLRMDGPRTASL